MSCLLSPALSGSPLPMLKYHLIREALVATSATPPDSSTAILLPRLIFFLCKSYCITHTHTHTHTPWWLSGKESACQCRRRRFDLWIRKIPWRRKWQPTPVFLPGKSHEQKSLAGYSPWNLKRVGHNLVTEQQQLNTYVWLFIVFPPIHAFRFYENIDTVPRTVPRTQLGPRWMFAE